MRLRKFAPVPSGITFHKENNKDVFRRTDLPASVHDLLSTRRISRTYAALMDGEDSSKVSRWFYRGDQTPRLDLPKNEAGLDEHPFYTLLRRPPLKKDPHRYPHNLAKIQTPDPPKQFPNCGRDFISDPHDFIPVPFR